MEVAQDEVKHSYKSCRTSNTYDGVIAQSHQMLRFVRTSILYYSNFVRRSPCPIYV